MNSNLLNKSNFLASLNNVSYLNDESLLFVNDFDFSTINKEKQAKISHEISTDFINPSINLRQLHINDFRTHSKEDGGELYEHFIKILLTNKISHYTNTKNENNNLIYSDNSPKIQSNLSETSNNLNVSSESLEFYDLNSPKISNTSTNNPHNDTFTSHLNKNNNILNSNNRFQKFRFRREHIIALTKACQEIVASQPIVLNLSVPIKIFGDIHGQYDDLIKFFDLWGEPSEDPLAGDINSIDYLFLGDFIDRGVNSLETICLLMALKIKYPDKIHLLRGNHEDALINSMFGFKDECIGRLTEDNTLNEDLDVFKAINEFFEYLPLAAIINGQILCIHGGIGSCLKKISQIEELKRPLKIVHDALSLSELIVMDILWSDPTDNDSEMGIQPNLLRDSRNNGYIVKYGPDVVRTFLKENNLSMIIRAHECVLDGFERFDSGNLITVFSATDYCKRHKNAGAMLVIKNNFEIVPHLIYPDNSDKQKWFDELSSNKRPITPLRNRKKS